MSLITEIHRFMLPRELHPNHKRVALELSQAERPLTAYDLELRCYLDVRNVREYLKLMHQARAIHIASWRRDAPRGPWVPVYCYGEGKDAVKPDRRTLAELAKQHRQKEGVKEREAARKRSQRTMIKLDNSSSIVGFILGVGNAGRSV